LRIGLRLTEGGGILFLPATLSGPAGSVPFRSLSAQVAENFRLYNPHIFITAAGIAVRCLAPLLRDKGADPAVLVVDQRARFVISLLSGHLGGANARAAEVAALLGAVPVITTATDLEGLPALDLLAREKGLAPAAAAAFVPVAAALLSGRAVGLHDPQDWLGLAGHPLFVPLDRPLPSPPCVVVTPTVLPPAPGCLVLHPPVLYAGIGLRRGIPAALLRRAVEAVLARCNLARPSLAALASVEAKAEEPGLVRVAAEMGLPLLIFSPDTLRGLPAPTPSPKAWEVFGLRGVCEPAALAAAQGLATAPGSARTREAVLLCPKQRFPGITVALALRTASP
jgi:cobalt-precorrin 5A hydrolase